MIAIVAGVPAAPAARESRREGANRPETLHTRFHTQEADEWRNRGPHRELRQRHTAFVKRGS